MALNSLPVRTKVLLAFGGLAAMVLAVSSMSVKSGADANARFFNYVEGVDGRAFAASELRAAVDRRAIAMRNLLLVTNNPFDLDAESAAVSKANDEVKVQLSTLTKLMAQAIDETDEARALVADLDKVEKSYGPMTMAMVDMVLNNNRFTAIGEMNSNGRPLQAALAKASNAFTAYTQQRARQITEEARAAYLFQRNLLLAASVLALTAATAAGLLITRSLMRSLGAEPTNLGHAAHRVATGDLRPLPGAAQARSDSVLASLAAMQASLAGIVGQVRDASDSISIASSQIVDDNSNLSERTERQASALQQTLSTMEQVGATSRTNADHAKHANVLARDATDVATTGGQIVALAVEKMRSVSQSSVKIGDIIAVMDGIAFQTNILALNAAVEAARAGDHGRSFGVVANEVRALSVRSAVAAKEIKTLINNSIDQVAEGTALVGKAGGSMGDVVASIKDLAEIIYKITEACDLQSDSVTRVGVTVTQIDEATKQNATLVGRSAAAADVLKLQAEQLAEAVAVFKLGDVGDALPAAADEDGSHQYPQEVHAETVFSAGQLQVT